MTAALERATQRIERYRRRNSDAVRLARLTSLAVRVEPYLLRRLRLELLPEVDVGTEADLWFGPLVESRGADAVVLDPQAADVLREDLATDRELFRQVRQVTRDAHKNAPPSIRLEEDLNALALLNEGNVVADIDEALRPAIRAVCEGGERAREIAHWVRRALPRVHPTVRRTQGATLLLLASDSLVGSRPRMKTPDADISPDGVSWILAAAALSQRVPIGVELVRRGLRFVEPRLETPAIELSDTNPLLVELEWARDGRRMKKLVEAGAGRTVDLEDDVSEITLRNLAGDEYVLERTEAEERSRPRADAPRNDETRRVEFENDVFISYAHIDDQALTEGQPGWISSLHRALEVRLQQLLGREVRIWRDPKLQGTDVFSDRLVDRLPRVAVFIAVLSPRYVKSEWCQRELNDFVKASAATGGVRVADKMRVFKVVKTPIPRERQPPDLQAMLGYEFFQVEPESGRQRELSPMSSPEAQRLYWTKLDDLAHDIADMLHVLEDQPSPSIAPNGIVYLAETSSGLEDQRASIRRDLLEYGYAVLPDRPLPLDAPECAAFVRDQLSRCQLSVHLVGENYGVVPDGDTESIVVLQYELAVERAKNGDFHRLVWMPVDSSIDDPRQKQFLDRLQSDPRYASGMDLLKTPLEDFRAVLHERLNAPPKDESSVEGKRIYLICDRRDLNDTRPLADFLFERQHQVILPAFDGDEAHLRQEHEANLMECDAAIVYYGAGTELWLRSKLRDLQKIAGRGRIKSMLAKAVYLAPPARPDKDRFRTHEAMVIRGGDAPTPDALRPFLEKLA